MDVLSDILGTLRLRGSLYFTTESHRPWGIRVPAYRRVARFHLVVRGRCWVRVVGTDELVRLEAGDLVLIPHGSEHVLADTPDTPCRTVEEVVRSAGFTGRGVLAFGGEDEGAPTRMVCGHFEFDEGLDHPLLDQLPDALVVHWDKQARESPLDDLLRFIAREVGEARPGHEAVVQRLSEVLFVQAVRAWAEREEPDRGLLAALADPRLGDALTAIHAAPEASWTLESLGREAALGRTTFAQRFKEVVGVTVHEYLTRWRVQLAKRLLDESRLPLDRIARRVGYESAASFSRMFRREVGTSPGAFRREVRATE